MSDYDGETDDRGTEVPEVGGFPFVITFYPRFEAAKRPPRLQMARSAHYAALGQRNGYTEIHYGPPGMRKEG